MTTPESTSKVPTTRPASDAADPVHGHLTSMRVHPLETFLADADTPCPDCGYNLRGHKGGICPECGNHLSVVATRRHALLAAALGLAIGVGFHGLLLLGLLIRLEEEPSIHRRCLYDIALVTPLFLAECLMLIVLLVSRRSFQRLSTALKRWTAVAAWAVVLIGSALFLAFM